MRSEAAELARQLAEHIDGLVVELFPRGRRDGHDWRIGSLAGEEGQSLCITVRGPKRGLWCDFASGEGGDVLDLVAATLFSGEIRSAMVWARRWLRMPGGQRPSPIEHRRQAHPASPETSHRVALGLWLAAKPLRPGDPVWIYLAGRGIDLGRWPAVPAALRYHPALWNRQSGRTWPAMVAAICDGAGHHVAVHRTWLEARNLACEPGPVVTKAPLAEPKRTLGSYRGGCVRLWRGASRRSWAQMRAGEALLLGEGLEDTLTAVQCWPEFRAACAVSLSSMLNLELPDQVAALFLLRQSDPPGSPAALLFERVVKSFLDGGRRVFILKYSAIAKDLNEYMQHPSQTGEMGWPKSLISNTHQTTGAK